MVYITTRQSPMYKQMTLEEFLFADIFEPATITYNIGNTRTVCLESLPLKIKVKTNVSRLINRLKKFNAQTEELRQVKRSQLYYSFLIPKKSGGYRRIDAPDPELMEALRNLKSIFEKDFGALYHTSAFAYVKKRSTVDAVKRHQVNESKWFGKFDLSDFFGSTTLEFVLKQFSMLYPFSEIMKREEGKAELEKALELAFLNGGLPQGTPISPLITNLIMIPIDHKLYGALRQMKMEDGNEQKFVYTRYADDFIISSRYDFDYRYIEQFVVDTLKEFGAPFSLNQKKTRYGSSAGKNFNLGLMLNKDNQITVGHKRKRQFQAMLASYVQDTLNGNPWNTDDVRVLEGHRSYYTMVEGDTIDSIVKHIGDKFQVDIVRMIREQIRG